MTMVFVSPAEPQRVKDTFTRVFAGTGHELAVHSKPEQHGVDFLWRARGAWYGVQRKELGDLLASMQDGRLSKELGQMAGGVGRGWVVVERHPQFTLDGVLLDDCWRSRRPFTHQAWVGLLASIHHAGVGTYVGANMQETATTVASLVHWTGKAHHGVGAARPGAASAWGTPTSREFGVHLLQGFPGIGPEVAGAIYDRFGRVPLTWTCTAEQLGEVAGMGKGRVAKVMKALPPLPPAVAVTPGD